MAGNEPLPLMLETDKDALKRCVLVTDLKLFTIMEQIYAYLSKFGQVEDATFVRRSDHTYSPSCIVLMEKEEYVDLILASDSEHTIYNGIVKVCQYEGRELTRNYMKMGNLKRRLATKRSICKTQITCCPMTRIELFERLVISAKRRPRSTKAIPANPFYFQKVISHQKIVSAD